MSWFADFKEFSVFTVLCLAVALVGGVLEAECARVLSDFFRSVRKK